MWILMAVFTDERINLRMRSGGFKSIQCVTDYSQNWNSSLFLSRWVFVELRHLDWSLSLKISVSHETLQLSPCPV